MKKSGFTLVELSIVLVIVGLLIGGVLTGQALIKAAGLRAISSEYTRYSIAVNAFKDRYVGLPGDLPNATTFWGKDNTNCSSHTGTAATNGTCNGNGDGSISYAPAAATTGEAQQLWRQLALAGLIEGSYTGISGAVGWGFVVNVSHPPSRFTGGGWTDFDLGTQDPSHPQWFPGTYGNVFFFGAPAAGGWGYTSGNILVAEDAYNVDAKLDDGQPATGKVRSWNYTFSNNCATTDALTAIYNATNKSVSCSLIFNMN